MSDTKTTTGKVDKSEAEWRRELTPMQYAVLREKATERPFSGEYEHEQRKGTYTCAGCGRPCRRGTRYEPRHGPHRGIVLEMQWPSRPRLRRRPGTDRPALLH